MPISTVCADCQKAYTVKDEMAGKRFRCKECQSIVTVPDASAGNDEDDPFSGADLQSTGEAIRRRRRNDEDDDEDELNPYSSPKSKPAKKKKARGPSIPLIGVVVIVLQCLLTLYPILTIIIVAYERDMESRGGLIGGMTMRLSIAVSVLVGLIRRKQNARQWSRGLCVLGMVVGGMIAGITLAIEGPSEDAIDKLVEVCAQWVLWLALVSCLSTESAEEWFDK